LNYSTGEFGAFVTDINDVGGENDKFWLWHYYDEDESEWQFGPVAVMHGSYTTEIKCLGYTA
jgi:hypothetical protein